ncbi:serine/threonine-protein kinase [Conchiformibius steedae]|uniref:serine/threonine-protein kinase n=1 Tax=Conchiformibius steedae TaxID=153493 RepID=UPI0026F16535|nr:serine/threonine-protein kinase [Conchiformibius steedae]
MSHPYPLAEGERLHQNYRVVRVLGSGGFGLTYLTEHIRLNTRFVIKEYFPFELATRDVGSAQVRAHTAQQSLFDKGLQYFYREAKLLHTLQHPNIVPVSDLFEANGTAYFVMPYIGGDTLADWLHSNPQPSHQDLQNIFLPLLDALGYLHAQHILHRDIKPQNILLKNPQTPILLDFGAARRFAAADPKTQHSMLFISEGYSPPEQYGDSGKLSAASDLYALTACLHQAVTGNMPPPAPERITHAHHADTLADKALYTARYPQAWLAAVDRGFQLSPAQRFADAAAMKQALLGQQTSLSIAPTLMQTPEPLSVPRRSRLVRYLAVWGVLLGLVVVGVMLYRMDTPAVPVSSDAIHLPASAAAKNHTVGGKSVPTDTETIEEWAERAKQNDTEALAQLHTAAENGHSSAQFYLGVMYDSGEGVAHNARQAAKWYRQAAEQGLAAAQANLGVLYEQGKGVAQDYRAAARWYRQAAGQGDVDGQFNLGNLYYEGKGIKQDYQAAFEWYRQAAEQGYADGQVNLGYMYQHGKGVPQNLDEAKKWYAAAAEQGHEHAAQILQLIEEYE